MRDSDRTDEQWRRELSPEQYHVLREKGTEPPFSGKYDDCKLRGLYRCAGCGNGLFESGAKFESGSGWPSFDNPVSGEMVRLAEDRSHLMIRTEVLCGNCGSHLGHVFDDGPTSTGQRYCINSLALDLDKDASEASGS